MTIQSQLDQVLAWRDIAGYEGLYQVSEAGDVRKTTTGFIRKIETTPRGYQRIYVSKNNKYKRLALHRVVALAFLPQEPGKPEINHKDGNKANNHVSNLEWVTGKENVRHSVWGLRNLIKAVIATNIDTGNERFFDAIVLADTAGFDIDAVHKALRGKQKTHMGHSWRYATPDEVKAMSNPETMAALAAGYERPKRAVVTVNVKAIKRVMELADRLSNVSEEPYCAEIRDELAALIGKEA